MNLSAKKKLSLICMILVGVSMVGLRAETDSFKTDRGELRITCLGHASLLFEFQKHTLYIDPYSAVADFSALPKADLILITHQHGDHLDAAAIKQISHAGTRIIAAKACAEEIPMAGFMGNGDEMTLSGIHIRAVPAYNIEHLRENSTPFHPRGSGNGYVLSFGKTRVYVAGDTEYIPEMKLLKNVTIAFLPVNLPYTMTAEMAFRAVRTISPRVFFPYHFFYGKTELTKLQKLMQKLPEIDMRLRDSRKKQN